MEKTNPNKQLAQRVRYLRKKQGLTQAQLGQKSSLSTGYIVRIESGEKNDLRLSTLSSLADALEVPLEYLISTVNLEGISKEVDLDNEDTVDELIMPKEDTLRVFYPPADKYKRINTLLELLLYLPLIDPEALSYSLQRIGGDVMNHEYYIMQQLNALIDDIPASSARAHADYIHDQIHHKRLTRSLVSDDISDPQILSNYLAYTQLLDLQVKKWSQQKELCYINSTIASLKSGGKSDDQKRNQPTN